MAGMGGAGNVPCLLRDVRFSGPSRRPLSCISGSLFCLSVDPSPAFRSLHETSPLSAHQLFGEPLPGPLEGKGHNQDRSRRRGGGEGPCDGP